MRVCVFRANAVNEEEEEEEEGLFRANAVNEEDPGRDRATPGGGGCFVFKDTAEGPRAPAATLTRREEGPFGGVIGRGGWGGGFAKRAYLCSYLCRLRRGSGGMNYSYFFGEEGLGVVESTSAQFSE